MRKRSYHDEHPSSPPPSSSKRDRHHQTPSTGKPLTFLSYTEIPNLPPKIRILCEIIAKTPSVTIERVLEETGFIQVSQLDVEEVLKLSYTYPGSAVKFFRWASRFQPNSKHTMYAWNLVVDLLGKNMLFDAMWDAIKSMKQALLLNLSTFVSVFSSYVMAGRVEEAVLSFEVIDQYGIPRDVVALNALLRSICTDGGKTRQAKEYLDGNRIVKADAETYAVLIEGWEKEGDVSRARQTFSDMVSDVGWDKSNVAAYDSFLCTLLKGSEGMREVLKFFDTMRDRGCYPGMKFFKLAIDECVRKSDTRGAKIVWDVMVGKNIVRPDTSVYKSLISLYCNVKEFISAEKLLDEMVYNGAFPDSETYGLLFHFLIKHRRAKDAAPIFKEMVKNEYVPTQEDCCAAVKAYVDAEDPHMGLKVWRCMIENFTSDLDETGNILVAGLVSRDMDRIPEAVKCAEDMIERGIKLNSATLTKLKQSLSKVQKMYAYEELLRKWKYH